MVDGLGIAGAAEGVAAVLLAAILMVRSGRRPAPIVLGLNFLAFAAILFLLSIPHVRDMALPPEGVLWVWIARLALWTSLIAFACIYPARSLSRRRRWFVAWSCIPAAGVVLSLLVAPSLVTAADGGPTSFLTNLVTLLRDLGLLLSLAVFGWHFLNTRGGPRRQQYAFIFVPYAIYGLNDGLSGLVPGFTHAEWGPPLFVALSIVIVASVLFIAGIAATRALQRPSASRLERLVVGWTAFALGTAFIQFVAPHGSTENLFYHFLVDGVAILVLFYGVAKEQILDIDLKVRWTIRSGTVAGIVLATFFVVSEVSQQFLAEKSQSQYIGIAATGVILFAIHPIQRVAERLSVAAVPDARPIADLAKDDRLNIYRQQVFLAWADGSVTRSEQVMLHNLRTRLDISRELADLVESEAVTSGPHGLMLDGKKKPKARAR